MSTTRRKIEPVAFYDAVTTTPSPAPQVLEEQRDRILEQAIGRLNPVRKLVLLWRIWDDLTFREIALRLATEENIRVDERTASNWYAEALEELDTTLGGITGAADLEDVE
jgi:DNA-directed RNA polymerase specialized sigma24 family protein